MSEAVFSALAQEEQNLWFPVQLPLTGTGLQTSDWTLLAPVGLKPFVTLLDESHTNKVIITAINILFKSVCQTS